MVQGLGHARPGPAHQLGEGRVAAQVGTEHHRVGEIAGTAPEPGIGASGHGCADEHVVLSRVAGDQRLERGELDDVGRGVLLPGEREDTLGQFAVQLEVLRGARFPRGLRVGVERGPAGGFQFPGEPRAPVGGVARAAPVGQIVALPGDERVVRGVVRRQPAVAQAAFGDVERAELVEQEFQGAEIGDEMVDHEEQHGPVGCGPQERDPYRRTVHHVEGLPVRGPYLLAQTLWRPVGGLGLGPARLQPAMHDLPRVAVPFGEGGAQGLVAAGQ